MSSDKTLVACLPLMTLADLERFEKEGGIWGRQRVIRRQQVTAQAAFTGASLSLGVVYSKFIRRNTWLIAAGTAPLYLTFGLVVGHIIGKNLYPSVADNKETTQMRYTWWAQQCAKNWNLDQIVESKHNFAVWKAAYPHSQLVKEKPAPPPAPEPETIVAAAAEAVTDADIHNPLGVVKTVVHTAEKIVEAKQ